MIDYQFPPWYDAWQGHRVSYAEGRFPERAACVTVTVTGDAEEDFSQRSGGSPARSQRDRASDADSPQRPITISGTHVSPRRPRPSPRRRRAVQWVRWPVAEPA